MPVESNIVVSTLRNPTELDALLLHLQQHAIHAMAFGPGMIRMVTHLDVDGTGIAQAEEAIASFVP